MSSYIRSILDELSPSIISKWLKLRDVTVVEFSDNHKLSKTEYAIRRRIKLVRNIPCGTKNFYFIDAKDPTKRHLVIVYKDFTMSYITFAISPDKVDLIRDERHEFIYPSELSTSNSASWTIFLLDTFGDVIWNHYFFNQLDANILKEYVLSANITKNESTYITLLFKTDYCKVFFLVDDKGYEIRIHVDYKLDCIVFRSISRVQDWNSGRKKPPHYVEVLESVELKDFSWKNYHAFINDSTDIDIGIY